jgi:hypothetical protein
MSRNHSVLTIPVWAPILLAAAFAVTLHGIQPASFQEPNCGPYPKFTDSYFGFEIATPPGWRISYNDGVIVLYKDSALQSGFIVYPIIPKPNYPARKALIDFLNILKSTNSTIEYKSLSESANEITTQVTGSISGKAVAGYAGVARSENTFIIHVGWTSPDNLNAEYQKFCRCIVQSYKKTAGTALVKRASPNGYFETTAPVSWKIEDSANGAHVYHPQNEAGVVFSYVDFGGDPREMVPNRLFDEYINVPCKSPGRQAAGEVCNVLLQKPYTILGTIQLPNFRDVWGRTWKTRGDEYEALLADNKSIVHGTTLGSVMDGQHITGMHGWIIIMSTRLSSPQNWDKYSAITNFIQSRMRVLKASEFITDRILPKNNPLDSEVITGWRNARNARESERSANLQEAIMGVEAYSTSSGTRYEVPLNSIPAGNGRIWVDEQTGLVWNSAIETPPVNYVPLIRNR